MRDYQAKLAAYKLPAERIRELREYCLQADGLDRDIIEAAAYEAAPDALAGYLIKHVTSTDYPWRALRAENIPCNRDTFHLRRAQFYCILSRKLDALHGAPHPLEDTPAPLTSGCLAGGASAPAEKALAGAQG